MGVAQAFVLYEPAFTVVAQRKALDFRRSVGAITLLGGLAGTVFVPGTQLLVELLGGGRRCSVWPRSTSRFR